MKTRCSDTKLTNSACPRLFRLGNYFVGHRDGSLVSELSNQSSLAGSINSNIWRMPL
jgi:hypothetical protein